MSNPAGFRFARPPALVVLALLSGGCVSDTEGGRGDYGPRSDFQAATASAQKPEAPADCRSEWGEVRNVRDKTPPARAAAPAAVLRDVVGESQAVEEAPVRAVVIPLSDGPGDPDPYRGVLLPDIKDD